MNKKFRFLFLIICFNSLCFGQFTQYSVNNSDIPNNTIRCLQKDNNDLLWIGTDNGLCNFNGTDWTIFNTTNSNIPSNQIRSVGFDNNNELWVGTFNSGLAHYDGTNWTIYNTSNSDLPDQFVRSIQFDNNNVAWIGTTGGLARYDYTDWTIWNEFNSDMWTNNISDLLLEPDSNDIFAGTINGGINLFVNDTLNMVQNSFNTGIPDNTIYGMDMDDNKWLWMGAPAGGIMIRVHENQWYIFNTGNSDIPTNSFYDLKINDNNVVFLASINNGLVIYEYATNIYENYDMQNSNIPTNLLYCLSPNNDRTTWIGTQDKGLLYFDQNTLSTQQNNDYSSDIKIFPNPTSNYLQLEIKHQLIGETLIINNLQGKEVSKYITSKSFEKIDVSNLKSGTYIIKIGKERKKLIVD